MNLNLEQNELHADDDFVRQPFHWFTGEIIEIDDPQKFNRVKVYCHGYHPSGKKKSEYKEMLPWATVMMPVTSAGMSDVGANHHLEVGSWVIGFFRDGSSAQDPVVIGSVTTSQTSISPLYPKGLVTADLHSSASTTNKIYRSKAGHLIELENKEDDETIKVTHAKGAEITIDKDNNISISNSGTTGITTTGDVNVTSTAGNITLASGLSKKTKII